MDGGAVCTHHDGTRGQAGRCAQLFTRLLYKERTRQLGGHVYSSDSKVEYFLGRHTPSTDLSLRQHAPAGGQGPRQGPHHMRRAGEGALRQAEMLGEGLAVGTWAAGHAQGRLPDLFPGLDDPRWEPPCWPPSRPSRNLL